MRACNGGGDGCSHCFCPETYYGNKTIRALADDIFQKVSACTTSFKLSLDLGGQVAIGGTVGGNVSMNTHTNTHVQNATGGPNTTQLQTDIDGRAYNSGIAIQVQPKYL